MTEDTEDWLMFQVLSAASWCVFVWASTGIIATAAHVVAYNNLNYHDLLDTLSRGFGLYFWSRFR